MVRAVGARGCAAIRSGLAIAAALGVLAVARPASQPASAQSSEGRIGAALAGPVEALPEITPELLALQQALVDALRARIAGLREEERVGQRRLADVAAAEELYFRELEALNVMSARRSRKHVSDHELLKMRIEVRSDLVALLKRELASTISRLDSGEITRSDVEHAKARALKAELGLEALKSLAGASRPRPSKASATTKTP